MEKSKVFFTDFRVQVGVSLLQKLKTLCLVAGIKKIDMEGKFVAIKMHFGELGNMAFLRPQYAKVVADLVKEQGGIPFLTDCNTLYPGSRRHAPEHMDCANLNGFNPTTSGCQIMKQRFRLRTACTWKKLKSDAPSWMQMCLSAWPILKDMK